MRYSVIRLDFAAGVLESRAQLDEMQHGRLRATRRQLGVDGESRRIAGCFGELIERAHAAHDQPVAVLVDEYDEPILDNIERPEIAAALCEGLRDLYSVSKDADIPFGLDHDPGHRVRREVIGPHSGPYRSRLDRRSTVRTGRRWPK